MINNWSSENEIEDLKVKRGAYCKNDTNSAKTDRDTSVSLCCPLKTAVHSNKHAMLQSDGMIENYSQFKKNDA